MPDEPKGPEASFWDDPSLASLQRMQSVKAIADPEELRGDFWPEEESIEDFLDALHEWRGHHRSDRAA